MSRKYAWLGSTKTLSKSFDANYEKTMCLLNEINTAKSEDDFSIELRELISKAKKEVLSSKSRYPL